MSPGNFMQNRWIVLAIIITARTGVGFQFIAMAALMPQLRAELDLSYSQVGLLLGLFMIMGVFLSLPSGMIAARVGDRRTLQAGLLALVVGGTVTAMSHSFPVALVGRLMGGVGAVFITVTGAKVLTDWFIGKEITTAMSMLGVTWPVGIALGMSLLPFLSAWEGWRVAVIATCALPAVALLLAALLPPAAPGTTVDTSKPHPTLWAIKRRELWLIIVAGAAWPLMSSGGYVVFTSYAPGLLVERGASQAAAALSVSLLSWLVIVSIPIGGYISDRTGRSDLLFWGGCLVSAAAIAMVPIGGPFSVWITVSAVLGLTVGPVMALPGHVLSAQSRGTGLGVFYTLYYLGTGCLPAFAGWLQDMTGSAAAVVWFSALCLLIAPIPLLCFRLLQRRWAVGHVSLSS